LGPRRRDRRGKIEVIFGPWPLPGNYGELPEKFYKPNPPDPEEGETLVTHRRGRHDWRRLRATDLLSQMEAAAYLGKSRMAVNQWVRAGKLRDVKILGTSRIRVSTLRAFAWKHGFNRVRGLFLTG
jgi:excisionase family DNA binding protein